jgi:hypothetical protein
MIDLLDEAADFLERRAFFDQLDASYAALRDDPEAWAEIEAERASEDGSVGDTSG